MNEKRKSKEDYIADARQDYEYWLEQLRNDMEQVLFFKKLLNGFGILVKQTELEFADQLVNDSVGRVIISDIKKRNRKGGTFGDCVFSCLEKAGKPLYTGELMQLVKEAGRIVSNSSNFGSQLNSTIKTDKRIMRDKVDGYLVWGLREWFESDHLKDAYITELIARSDANLG
jgi:hypothetical protein